MPTHVFAANCASPVARKMPFTRNEVEEMEQVHLNIDGKEIVTTSERTILEAARENGIRIPSLCYEQRMEPYGACRISLVEVEGARGLLPACYSTETDGMVGRAP